MTTPRTRPAPRRTTAGHLAEIKASMDQVRNPQRPGYLGARVVHETGGSQLPVRYEPRTKFDARPWVFYAPGLVPMVRYRFAGPDVRVVDITDAYKDANGHRAATALYVRLAQAGVFVTSGGWDSAGTYACYRFADATELTWAPHDRYGDGPDLHVPVTDFDGFGATWNDDTGPDPLYDAVQTSGTQFTRSAGALEPTAAYAEHVESIAEWILHRADQHGRTVQDHPDSFPAAIEDYVRASGAYTEYYATRD